MTQIDEIWQELLDKDDRTSPAEYAEMVLITRDELAQIVEDQHMVAAAACGLRGHAPSRNTSSETAALLGMTEEELSRETAMAAWRTETLVADAMAADTLVQVNDEGREALDFPRLARVAIAAMPAAPVPQSAASNDDALEYALGALRTIAASGKNSTAGQLAAMAQAGIDLATLGPDGSAEARAGSRAHLSGGQMTRPLTKSLNPHPFDGMSQPVDCGDGAVMDIIDPRSFEDGGPEWVMRYGNPNGIRYGVAMLLSSYDYLLCSEISTKEAIRRLRLMRQARAECRTAALLPQQQNTTQEKT